MKRPYRRYDAPKIIRFGGDDGTVSVNREFSEQLGLGAENLEKLPLEEWIHPADMPALTEAVDAGKGCVTARHRTAAGNWIALDWEVKKHADRVAILGLLPSNDESPAHSRGPDAPRSSMSETLDAMARIVEDRNPERRCSILLLDENQEYIIGGAGPSLPPEYNAAVEGLRIGPGVGSCGTAAFWNLPVVVENIAEDPLWEELRDAAALAGVQACWSHPITASNGSVLGAMALYDDEPRAPARHEMDGLAIAARMVGLAIERNRLEEQVRQSAKLEALGVLAGGIAHDFNNMLAVVLGNAELASESLHGDQDAMQRLQAIVTACGNASDLCNQMLSYAGRHVRATEDLNVNVLARELCELMRTSLSKKASLTFELNDRPIGIRADQGQIRQVVMNLVTNASEAIGDNQGEIVVGTTAENYTREQLLADFPGSNLSPGRYAVLTVRDTGSGMDETTRSKIFDPFFTTRTTGRGLGLAVVNGIVKGHQGEITLTSEPGKGTTVQVLLPAVDLSDHVEPTAPAAEIEPSRARILLADDEDDVRTVFARILEKAGYFVIPARDGQEAVDIFRTDGDAIDCVVLDLSMPKLNGDEVFRELRSMKSDVPVILSSGYAEQQIMDQFDGLGLAGVLQKPAQMNVLLEKVSRTLARSAIR